MTLLQAEGVLTLYSSASRSMRLFKISSAERWEASAAGKWGSDIVLKRKQVHAAVQNIQY